MDGGGASGKGVFLFELTYAQVAFFGLKPKIDIFEYFLFFVIIHPHHINPRPAHFEGKNGKPVCAAFEAPRFRARALVSAGLGVLTGGEVRRFVR